jgi:hypothetical protein
LNGQLAVVAGMGTNNLSGHGNADVTDQNYGYQRQEWNKGYAINIPGKCNSLAFIYNKLKRHET